MKKDLVLLQQEYPWLKDVDSCILRTTLDDLEKGYDNFFKKRNSYPKFKGKNNHEVIEQFVIEVHIKAMIMQVLKLI